MLEFERIAIALLEEFEGLKLRPYLCPARVPTIGLGSTRYMDGRRVTLADPPITREHAYVLARDYIGTKALPEVLALCPGIDNQRRLAAIIDFHYNLGGSNLRISTLRKRINAGRWDDVPAQLLRWKYADGRVMAGLVRRRSAEIALCR